MAKEKILVVDDEQNVRETICELLKEEGYEPVEAKDSEEAEEKTKKEVIDLALIDLKMPGMNGLQLIQRIRKFNPDIQIVIITGYPSLESAREAIREEVYDYLTKPFSADELKSTVKKSLEKQQLVIANKKLMKELKEAKANLEGRVKERTKELEESRNELVRDITKRKKLEEQINSLFEVSREIVSTLTIENTLNQIMNMSLVMLNGDAGSLMLIDEKTKKLHIKASSGLKEKIVREVNLKVGERIAGWVVEHEEPLLIIDGFKNDPQFSHFEEREEIKSALCVPLKIKDTVIGVLNVNNLTSETNFTEKDLELLSTFANQAAVAIENAHLYEELITAKEYVDNIIKSMIDTLIVIDPDGSIKNVNQATLDLLGYKEDELIGQPAGVLFAEEEEEEEELFKGRGLNDLIKKGFVRNVEKTYRSKDGRKIPVLFSGSVMRDDDGKIQGIACVALDITERKQVEEQVLRSERLAGVGELASGIAHEIRNPLGNISASAQLCLSKYELNKEMKKHLRIILRNSENANRIIKELLDFAKPRELSFESSNISEVIDRVCSLVKAKCSKQRVRLTKRYSRGLPQILLDKKRLEDAFLNFILNSLDAMPDGGRLAITVYPDYQNNDLVVSFSDTGNGIAQEELSKIFDPFFTTKKEGTGLGLNLAQQVTNYHNGRLDVESEVGRGTEVIVRLPIPGEEV